MDLQIRVAPMVRQKLRIMLPEEGSHPEWDYHLHLSNPIPSYSEIVFLPLPDLMNKRVRPASQFSKNKNRRSISKMEGVGARLGRTSTRHGPATVFTGPVRKWKKKWVHVAPPSNHNTSTHHSHQINGASNGINGSHLLLYKWTPIAQSQSPTISNGAVANGGDRDKVSAKDDGLLTASEEPPRRKFKYIPIALLEEQENDSAEQVEDDGDSSDNEPVETESTLKNEGLEEKPDINDIPMEENQESNQVVCQDLNLSLGLNGHENDNDSGLKAEQTRNG